MTIRALNELAIVRLLSQKRICHFEQKRHKYKEKWAVNRGKREPDQIALRHFDHFYSPVYKHLWPSIRVSLLSLHKYGLVVNNYSRRANENGVRVCEGLIDVVKLAEATPIRNYARKFKISDLERNSDDQLTTEEDEDGCGDNKHCSDWTTHSRTDEHKSSPVSRDPCDLHSFMPVTRMYSESEIDEMEEVQQSVYEPRDISIDVIPETDFALPTNLRVGVFDCGIVRDFPAPKVDPTGLLPYYLMDASSILPVVAMGIQRDDKILDLCAAPGGKSLLMLQTLLTEHLTCNDTSYSRLGRLFDILRSYLPSVPSSINVSQKNGALLNQPLFDKVLVDAPCNTDRHMLMEQDQNLFRPSRFKERMQLPDTQKNLLIGGIKSCVPGGSVVYSTCTLSPVQNDGTVQAAIEDIWKNTDIDISIVDTSWIAEKFRKTFRFYPNCRYGQLVLPTLTGNFGPTYFCKIHRSK